MAMLIPTSRAFAASSMNLSACWALLSSSGLNFGAFVPTSKRAVGLVFVGTDLLVVFFFLGMMLLITAAIGCREHGEVASAARRLLVLFPDVLDERQNLEIAHLVAPAGVDAVNGEGVRVPPLAGEVPSLDAEDLELFEGEGEWVLPPSGVGAQGLVGIDERVALPIPTLGASIAEEAAANVLAHGVVTPAHAAHAGASLLPIGEPDVDH